MIFRSFSSLGARLAGLLMLGFSLCVSAAENDRPPFYQFEQGGKKVSLLGSMHMGKADFYPMPQVIEQAFVSSKALVVEADIGASAAKMQQLLQQYGVKSAKPDPQTAAVLQDYCRLQQPVCAAISSFSPWVQATQITLMRFTSLGFNSELGVDIHLLQRARDHKAILELEGVEFQFALMSSLSEPQQWAMVREAIKASDQEMSELVSHWRSGNEDALDRMMRESMDEGGDQRLLKIMMWDRNQRMADSIMSLLAKSDTPSELMVVVGAAHLVGEKSIVEFLTAKGVKLTRPLGTASTK